MLTDAERKNLMAALRTYENALLDGDSAEAVIALDELICDTFGHPMAELEDEDNRALRDVIHRALDERAPIEAVDWVRAAQLIVGTL